MAGLYIYQEKLTPELAARLSEICPFGALKADGARLSVEAGCRMCRLCVKKSGGVIIEQKDEGSRSWPIIPTEGCIRSLWSFWARPGSWRRSPGTRYTRC